MLGRRCMCFATCSGLVIATVTVTATVTATATAPGTGCMGGMWPGQMHVTAGCTMQMEAPGRPSMQMAAPGRSFKGTPDSW